MGNPFDLSGRVALITGSGSGLGRAVADHLAAAGAHVVISDRDAALMAQARDEIIANGHKASGYAFDVCDAGAVDAAVVDIEATVGPIDILINNAGITRRGPLESFDDDDWQAVMDVNLTALFKVTKRVVGSMIARKRGKIVNLCSLMSEIGRQDTGAYAASKGGVKMLTKAMAVEWAKHNIQVNGIGPGYLLTNISRPLAADPKFNAWIVGRTPAGRWGDASDLGGTAVYLASDASNFVSGQVIYVDGGILATI